MKPYYKTSDGKVVKLKQQKELFLDFDNIIELLIPDVCKYIECDNNQLTELIIPDGCKWVSCYNNKLKELIIPDGCGFVLVDMKSVTELNKVKNLNLLV